MIQHPPCNRWTNKSISPLKRVLCAVSQLTIGFVVICQPSVASAICLHLQFGTLCLLSSYVACSIISSWLWNCFLPFRNAISFQIQESESSQDRGQLGSAASNQTFGFQPNPKGCASHVTVRFVAHRKGCWPGAITTFAKNRFREVSTYPLSRSRLKPRTWKNRVFCPNYHCIRNIKLPSSEWG